MDLIIHVNNQSNGRDKLARLFQYTSKLVWHQLETRNANKYSVDRIRNLENTLSTFRKILRLGRCADMLYLSLNSMNIEEPWLRVTITVSKLAQALYLYADHIVWLTKSGLLKTETDWSKRANKFWLLSIIANLIRDVYEIIHVLQLRRSTLLKPPAFLNSSAEQFDMMGSLNYMFTLVNCHKDIFLDTLKNSCDLLIPLTALGFTKLSPSMVGAFGAISSLAALVTVVKPITKLVPS